MDECRPQEGGHPVRRTTLLLMLALMAGALVAASGVAVAKNIVGTERGERNRSFCELRLLGLLGSSPLWSFQKFASGRIATPDSTSLNGTFAGT
jgi:hypothetical protein